MNKIQAFFQNHKYFITWTICYLFVLWAILYYLFSFSIFNTLQWQRLAHSPLHGFVGFVFGTIILAAPLIYISTSALIIRNKKPLITIPLPKISLFFKKKEPTSPAPETKESKETTPDNTPELDSNIPQEIRAAFIRAKNHPLDIKINLSESNSTNDTVNIEDTALPLPPDFDISFDSEESPDKIPTFTDFNFDENTETNNTSSIIEHLNNTNTKYDIIDDIIITETHAIATHDDSDFWVVDNENWFATGKTKPSPILAVKSIAEQHNVKPVLYLAEQNIMDIETLIPQWESDDITVITDINDL